MQIPKEDCSRQRKRDAKALRQEPQQVFREQEGDPCGWRSQLGESGTKRWQGGQSMLNVGPINGGETQGSSEESVS